MMHAALGVERRDRLSARRLPAACINRFHDNIRVEVIYNRAHHLPALVNLRQNIISVIALPIG